MRLLDLQTRQIAALHGCESVAIEKEMVDVRIGGKPLTLCVTKYELMNHASAEFCYAWAEPTSTGDDKMITALAVGAILSASDAVRSRHKRDAAEA